VAVDNNNEVPPVSDRDSGALHAGATTSSASQHRDDLLEEARTLKTAGKIREARKKLKAAQEIQHRLTALETEARLRSRYLLNQRERETEEVPVYSFEIWDPENDRVVTAPRMGTADAIRKAKGMADLESKKLVGSAELDPQGFLSAKLPE
jgi:hypothetical protein